MKDLKSYQVFYFLGIGGIGMSALARYLNRLGKTVAGYDKTPTSLTAELEKEGIKVHYEDDITFFRTIAGERKDVIIVRTPAVPNDHSELQFFLKNGYDILKRSELLGMISAPAKTLAVAGTHGKTTTTSMLAHILKSALGEVTAFMGGISKNYNTNFLLGGKAGDVVQGDDQLVVVEADEYDRSFLTLKPTFAAITSMDPDHLDIYGDESAMHESYNAFAKLVKSGLIVKKGLDISSVHKTYSVEEKADFYADNIRIEKGNYVFDFHNGDQLIKDLILQIPGRHNLENATAALSLASMVGLNADQLRKGIETYEGVRRRFDYQVRTSNRVYIDDYAHHPAELKACILAVKEMYPNKKITGIFQPHLFSRTRDFASGFSESLSLLDEVILLPIYPAREKPIPGITSEMLLQNIRSSYKKVLQMDQVLPFLKTHPLEVLLTLGAGDIDTLVVPIRNMLQNEN